METSQQCSMERELLRKAVRKYGDIYFGVNLNQRTYDLVCRCFDYHADTADKHPPRNLDAFLAAPAWPELMRWCEEQGFSCSRGGNGIRIRKPPA